MLNEPLSLLSGLCCSPAFSSFPCGRGPGGWAAQRNREFFISSNYIKPDERLEAKASTLSRNKHTTCWGRSRGLNIKGEEWKWLEGRHKPEQLERQRITPNSGMRIVRKMHYPCLCPRPTVCLHQSSAKRTDKTEEPGEAQGRRRRRVRKGIKGEGEWKAEDSVLWQKCRILEVESALGGTQVQLSHGSSRSPLLCNVGSVRFNTEILRMFQRKMKTMYLAVCSEVTN